MKLKYTPQALNDLQELKTYIGKTLHNVRAARRITKSILDSCGRLKEHPQLGMSLEAKTGIETDLRYLLCEKHLALYHVEDDLILVVRILDGRSDYLRILFPGSIE
ncbi:MAG: type II toxin-antitoxin system RelE/ParE family toxin [Oscillospiraceae bacterium]|nr:type II toxin-antitoxin system RelE/ParE family toxin [Oscillospiraceae bacterium]